MRRRKSAKVAQPFDAVEQIVARSPRLHQRGNYFSRDITKERWLQHGALVMAAAERSHREQVERYGPATADAAPWPWLLWGDPAGYISQPGARRAAQLDEIAGLERVVVAGNSTPEMSAVLAELRSVLAAPELQAEKSRGGG